MSRRRPRSTPSPARSGTSSPPLGVRVAVVAPGLVATNIIERVTAHGLGDAERARARLRGLVERLGASPDDVAHAIERAAAGGTEARFVREARALEAVARLAPWVPRALGRALGHAAPRLVGKPTQRGEAS
jgi:NAD(P)-dependent dehydrogenase (short-subunit alcohol dehydrogenase family)